MATKVRDMAPDDVRRAVYEALEGNRNIAKLQSACQDMADRHHRDFFNHTTEIRNLRREYELKMNTRLQKQMMKDKEAFRRMQQTYSMFCILFLMAGITIGFIVGYFVLWGMLS